jgi:quinol monooxygenase YgiN
MSGFAVVVDFLLKPGMRAAFRDLIDANAHASVKLEPDCLRFDVIEPEGEPDRVLLYEIYRQHAAFQVHMASAHYARFAEASADLCLSKSVVTGALVCEGGA